MRGTSRGHAAKGREGECRVQQSLQGWYPYVHVRGRNEEDQ